MWNISAVLNDAENTPPTTFRDAKRARDDDLDTQRKRHRLAGISANGVHPSYSINMSRTPSPSKRRHLRSGHRPHDLNTDETTMPTPLARRSRRHPTDPIDPDHRFTTRFPPASDDDLRSYDSASSQSTKHTSRSKSPMKDAVDLRLADASIRYCRRGQVDLPKCIDDLCEELDAIAEGDGLVPEDIWAQMQQRGEGKLKARHRAPPDAKEDLSFDDHHDIRQLYDVLKDAIRQEDDNTSEASWNAEVHAPVLRVALRPYAEALYFHNVQVKTTAKPVPSRVPTRELQASESRLVDYSINLDPSSEERAAIEAFLRREPYGHATITQTMYAAVRERPCIASIETKTVSEFDKAKNQLAVWGAAHISRLREFASSAEDDQPLFENSINIVNVNIIIGATDTLLNLWKLVRSLRFLARWAQSVYRESFFSCIKRCNARV
ncbi:hypothetical protein CERZMDRAFT_48466 [Cercospora zeae-maydis SCOH1-5]|uniref:PD-(D/E)XK nuclease-like domain-containing protein n=1 Tax=Cercospora zeae-maydis SCOH1-5 TaxID=717836 RepID=A0A6A6F6H9_9PEZI|nr:hypothetical protein CERZMDRAFT_48466 [Cercospora zeae-maydis SCOH1-5]